MSARRPPWTSRIAAGGVAAAGTAESPSRHRRRRGRAAGGTGPGRDKSTAFNPAISLILAGNYADLSKDPDD